MSNDNPFSTRAGDSDLQVKPDPTLMIGMSPSIDPAATPASDPNDDPETWKGIEQSYDKPEASEPRQFCKHCDLRIYQPVDRPKSWFHHGSNLVLCHGGLKTSAEPVEQPLEQPSPSALPAKELDAREWLVNLPDNPDYKRGKLVYPPRGQGDIAVLMLAFAREYHERKCGR